MYTACIRVYLAKMGEEGKRERKGRIHKVQGLRCAQVNARIVRAHVYTCIYAGCPLVRAIIHGFPTKIPDKENARTRAANIDKPIVIVCQSFTGYTYSVITEMMETEWSRATQIVSRRVPVSEDQDWLMKIYLRQIPHAEKLLASKANARYEISLLPSLGEIFFFHPPERGEEIIHSSLARDASLGVRERARKTETSCTQVRKGPIV